MTTTPSQDNSPSLWAYSLERYARPGVQEAAIALQDKLGADVNLLFFCTWQAATGRPRLCKADFERIEKRISRWREEVTLPLRRVRNNLKYDAVLAGFEDAQEVRAGVIGAEVESERVAQIVIEASAGPAGRREREPAIAVAKENLGSYLAYIDAQTDADSHRHLQDFLNGVFT